MPKPSEMDWGEAERHLRFMKQAYAELGVAGNPALVLTIMPLEKRLAMGERSEDLHSAIMSVE